MRAWNVQDGKGLWEFGRPGDKFQATACSPDGRRVVASSGGPIRLLDVQTGKCALDFKGHDGSTYSVMFSPDGRDLLSASTDGTIKIWQSD